MSIRTITAPGIQLTEIDKSMYSPAITGSNVLLIGFTSKGEPYIPQEFTSRTAWTNSCGIPDTEAERYSYAAACEVLNQNGRLYFARLPYDNPAFEKVAGFTYNIDTAQIALSSSDQFKEVYNADSTVSLAYMIKPASRPALYDLSSVDAYRTDEAKVQNNSFMIFDKTFGTYGKIQEDSRKGRSRELVGIMPVVTTAANAMHAQRLIEVENYDVVKYETVGTVKTIDAAASLSAKYPSLSCLTPNALQVDDAARLLNTRDYYWETSKIHVRIIGKTEIDSADYDATDNILSAISSCDGDLTSWNGQWQVEYPSEDDAKCSAAYSFTKGFTSADIQSLTGEPYNFDAGYVARLSAQFGWHNKDGDDSLPATVSQEANGFFPTIGYDGRSFERQHLKKIGVVVYKMFVDPAEGNKISFEPVEAYAGSLNRNDKDPNTNQTAFIDTIVNSQSEYIYFFSNCFNTPDMKTAYEAIDILLAQPGSSGHPKKIDMQIDKLGDFNETIQTLAEALGEDAADYSVTTLDDVKNKTSMLQRLANNAKTRLDTPADCNEAIQKIEEVVGDYSDIVDSVSPSLGFYSEMAKKEISIGNSIYKGLTNVFENSADLNKFDIDIVPDAGTANIASYIKAVYGEKGQYDLQAVDDAGNSLLSLWKVGDNAATKVWKTVEQKFDTFCKTRKDCMFIADGLRPLVLQGQKPIIRDSKPNNTIDECILPYLRYLTGLNTSYGAAYLDWFEVADDYSGDLFWCPPSIKATGVYIYTDVNYNYWDAPAGLNRGIVAATDVAFSPTIKQAGSIYEKSFNYAIKYPNDGIALEGQKTLQTKPTSLDRVNVRRLFLRLERAAWKTARWFVYEGNTSYTRQRFVDALDPYFKEAKLGGGLYDYVIRCDENINTDEVIDRNELKVQIGIKPVKSIEFIMIDFIPTRTGMTWQEAGIA